ncbi:MAG: MFS transporter [Spirochaetes bacterium]|nr:MFS transporter [Spirochaetota bacterium]
MKLWKKWGYAAGDMGISISYFTVSFFLMYYFTEYLKMDPFLAGLAIFIGKLWDGINDPFIGILSDKTKSKYGKKRVYFLFGAFPFAVSFLLLWFIPPQFSEFTKFIIATFTLLLYATTYSFVVVPYMAMIPVISKNYNERTQITGFRAIFSSAATITGGMVAFAISSESNEAIALKYLVIVFAIFTFFSLLIAAASTKGYENSEHNKPVVEVKLKEYLKILTENNTLILMIFKLFGAAATGCLSASLPYFAQYILGDKGISSKGLAIYVISSALFIYIWNKASYRFNKKNLILLSNIFVFLILFIIGFFVETNVLYFYSGCFFLGIFMSSYLILPYSLVPDLVDYCRYKTGVHHESIFFGVWISTHQLGLAISGIMIGVVLKLSQISSQGSEIIKYNPLGIKILFGLIPGILLLTGSLILQLYKINRNTIEEINNNENNY